MWRPRIDADWEFNPFTDQVQGSDYLMRAPHIREARDTAPLQGTRDLTDMDSLNDVIADAERT